MKEEASSKGEDAFPMEMRGGWCPLASRCIMSGIGPLSCKCIQLTTRSPGRLAGEAVSHTAAANRRPRPLHHLSLIISLPPPFTPARPVFSSDPCTSQLPPPTFHSRAVDSPFPGNTPQKKFRRKRIQEEEEEEGQRGQKGAGPAWIGWKEDISLPGSFLQPQIRGS